MTSKLSVNLLTSLSLTIGLSAGCSEIPVEVTSTTGTVEFANTLCPVMGNPVDKEDPSMVREWKGKKVGFCCPPCLEEWDEYTDAEKSERLANPPKDDGAASHDHADHDHSTEKAAAPATEPSSSAPPEGESAEKP